MALTNSVMSRLLLPCPTLYMLHQSTMHAGAVPISVIRLYCIWAIDYLVHKLIIYHSASLWCCIDSVSELGYHYV